MRNPPSHLMTFELAAGHDRAQLVAYAFVCIVCTSKAEAQARALRLLNERGYYQVRQAGDRVVAPDVERLLLPVEQRLVRAAQNDVSKGAVLLRPSQHVSSRRRGG